MDSQLIVAQRALFAALSFAAAAACGASSSDMLLGSETHFLACCTLECGGGLACIDGVCTRACSADAECNAIAQDETTIFVRQSPAESLYAVRKPR